MRSTAWMSSPVGSIAVTIDSREVIGIDFEDRFTPLQTRNIESEAGLSDQNKELHQMVFLQLRDYFEGGRMRFDFPIRLTGTDFQKRVWSELLTIPYGETRTYQDVAQKMGDIRAVRAVGGAIGRNPISIVVPCHRVIGKNGKLTGYAGGLHRKQFLLQHESSPLGLAWPKDRFLSVIPEVCECR